MGVSKTKYLKSKRGYKEGFVGEGEISYTGQHALDRAQLAGDIVRKRLQSRFSELRVNYIGCVPVHPLSLGKNCKPYEVRLRVAGKVLKAANWRIADLTPNCPYDDTQLIPYDNVDDAYYTHCGTRCTSAEKSYEFEF